ncbi:MAG TPA: hypothetical protein P5228_05210 [Bacteroidales bacterium]|nr:hypothetical protein [Bacteroidales bacterium]HRZ49280.1 hypothetical protein [Bacteroidales bacterium]
MKYRNLTAIVLILATLTIVPGCEKPEGEGGLATIRGRVLVKHYNSSFNILEETYYAQDEDVFIIYGDEKSVGDRVRTTYDGWFEFPWLRPGKYMVYAYSKDSTLQTQAKIPVIREVEITDTKQQVEVPEIVIFESN